MEVWQLALLVVVGVATGVVNVLAGGGSLLSLPIMLFLGVPGPVANGTNRIAILAQNIVAITTFFRRGIADFKLGLSLGLASIPGAIAGALVGVRLEGEWFERVIALVMLVVMVLMVFENKVSPSTTEAEGSKTGHIQISKLRLVVGHICMLGIGFWGGFIQVGVGFLLMPVLNKVLGLDLVRVNAHKVIIVGLFTLVSLVIYASKSELSWQVGVCLAIGTSIGGWLGAKVSMDFGAALIRPVFYAILCLFVIKLLFF